MKKILLFFLALSIGLSIYSQSLQQFQKTPIKENPELKIETPNVSQMSRYDDMAINEYLGIPDISIPLCNMKLSDISIPLSLSYQATGIKVNQDASCVGIGWDLNSLGSVVQIVRGDDDMNPYNYPHLYRLLPDYFSSNYIDFLELPVGGWNTGYPINTDGYPIEPVQEKYGYRMIFRDYFPINGKLVMNSQFRYSTTYWDSEPDIFIINILGEKLHCVTSDFSKSITQGARSSRITVLNKIGYKVEMGASDTWIVTNPDGVHFYFGLKQSFRPYTITSGNMLGSVGQFGDSSTSISSNTWYLTKIETAVGTVVDLSYDTSEEVEFTTLGNGTVEYVTSSYQTNYDPGYTLNYILYMFVNKGPVTGSTVKSTIKEKQYVLKEINSNKSKIKFNYTSREDISKYKKLESIMFSFDGKDPVRTVSFSYDYKANIEEGKRLFLNSLNVNGESYNFKYDQTQLPSRNSFAQDYWGYYNGSLNNNSLVPNPKRFGWAIESALEAPSYYGPLVNNMSANIKYTKAGILEKIIYPTNGSVEFEYELNTFKNFWVPNYTNTNNPRSAGSEGFGLRIKSIIHKESDSKILKKKTYEYYGGKSVILHQFDKEGNIDWLPSPNNPPFSMFYRFRAMSTASLSDVNPFSTHSGIGYDSVSCVFESVGDSQKYRTTTYYHNMPHYSSAYQAITRNMLHTIHMPSFENSNYPKNGSIKEKNYYNSLGQLVKKEEYEYENKKSNLFYGAKLMKIHDVIAYGSLGTSRYLLGYYPIFDFESLLSKKTEKSYTNSQVQEIETTYGYNSNRLLSSTMVKNSQNRPEYRYLKYPTDYSTTSIYSTMINKNILSPVIKESSVLDNGTIISEITTNYAGNSTNVFILPSSVQSNSYDNNSLRTEITFDRYDTKGKVLQTTKLTGLSTIYLWAYSNQYLVAEIKNTTYEVVESALAAIGLTSVSALASNMNPDKDKLDKLRTLAPLSDAHVITYTYKPLVGILTATDPRGVTTYYDYDSFGRLKETYIIENSIKKIIQVNDYHYQNQ